MNYSQSLSKPQFNWFDFLRTARPFDITDIIIKKAADWPTCAVGQQCAALPRHLSGAPVDGKLYDLGTAFYQQILAMSESFPIKEFNHHRKEAIKILHRIEARATELLKS